jgi:hypothetical protein
MASSFRRPLQKIFAGHEAVVVVEVEDSGAVATDGDVARLGASVGVVRAAGGVE